MDAVVYFRVVDPIKAVVNVQNYLFAVSQQAQTSLRSIIGQSEMDQLLSDRELVNRKLRRIIDGPTEGPRGIRVERVEIRRPQGWDLNLSLVRDDLDAAAVAPPPETPIVIQKTLLGRCAGFASRFAAFAVDVAVSVGVFLLALAAISFTARVLTGRDIAWNRDDIWVVIACGAWEFVYFAYCWAASGRTAGMALSGVRVVSDDGSNAGGRRAVVRTLALLLSFLLLGLGFVGILLGGQRRALHDVIAGTAVIYSWDARAARLRFLSRG